MGNGVTIADDLEVLGEERETVVLTEPVGTLHVHADEKGLKLVFQQQS